MTRSKAAADLSSRYVTDRFLPDKAIDLIDEAAARVRIRHARPRRPSLRERPEGWRSVTQGEGRGDQRPAVRRGRRPARGRGDRP